MRDVAAENMMASYNLLVKVALLAVKSANVSASDTERTSDAMREWVMANVRLSDKFLMFTTAFAEKSVNATESYKYCNIDEILGAKSANVKLSESERVRVTVRELDIEKDKLSYALLMASLAFE